MTGNRTTFDSAKQMTAFRLKLKIKVRIYSRLTSNINMNCERDFDVQCIVREALISSPFCTLFCSCDKVYCKLEVHFLLYLLDQIVT